MDIREIYKGCLYSIKFDEADTDEYSRVIGLWKDLDYLVNFFRVNAKEVDQPFWREVGLNPNTPMASAERVASEAIILAAHIRDLAQNASEGELPDFEDFFILLAANTLMSGSLNRTNRMGHSSRRYSACMP
ncbi:MAG: DUF3343 domain-containing protein [Muribaculaceae bacterium]|nr:DUF3343 domain-containing protein [Muribaculaceae bacterium]